MADPPLTSRGVPTDGVRLSKRGDGVWLAGFGGAGIARRAAAAVRLEGSFRASPGQALYGLGPIKDPGEVQVDDAERALRAILVPRRQRRATR